MFPLSMNIPIASWFAVCIFPFDDVNATGSVDDVFDTGKSIEAVIIEIRKMARRNTPEQIRVATPYFKPSKNLTDREPEYFNEKLDDWLVFPHELCGLLPEEIARHKPEVAEILATIKVS